MNYPIIGAIWFVAAFIAAVSGAVGMLRPPLPQLILAGITIALLAGWQTVPSFKRWIGSLTWKELVSLHLIRYVGLYFLWCYYRGLLPFDFAVPAGLGDIVIALSASVLLLRPELVQQNKKLLSMWNLIGLLDILLVVATAAQLAVADPESMGHLLEFPLALLPTFFVPLIIASHLALLTRGNDPPPG